MYSKQCAVGFSVYWCVQYMYNSHTITAWRALPRSLMTVITGVGSTLWIGLPCITAMFAWYVCCGVCCILQALECVWAWVWMMKVKACSCNTSYLSARSQCRWHPPFPPLVQEGKVILEKALVGEENGIEGEDHSVQNWTLRTFLSHRPFEVQLKASSSQCSIFRMSLKSCV